MFTVWLLIIALVVALLGGTQAAAQSSPTYPAPPQNFIDTTYNLPTGGMTWTVGETSPGVGDVAAFRNALTNSIPGDVIILKAGAIYTGNFTAPVKTNPNNRWIYIQSSNYSSLPAPGQRVQRNDPNLTIIRDNSGTDWNPAITVEPGANYYRFVGIELTTTWTGSDASPYFAIVNIPYSGTDLSQEAHHIYFDRCYIHGTDQGYFQHGIAAQGNWIAVIDSYISNIHLVSKESYAFRSFNGGGPVKIVNNQLEAAGVNVMFGGQDPTITNPLLVPSDIEVRGNHFLKLQTWYPNTWGVKNHLELKNAQRVLIDGNTFENNWPGFEGQTGFSVLFTPRNDNGGCTWCVLQDVTFTHNTSTRATAGIFMRGYDNNLSSQQLQRALIQNNLFVDIGQTFPGGGTPGYLFGMADGPGNVVIDHNTAFQSGVILEVDTCNTGLNCVNRWPVAGFFFTNNITPDTQTFCDGVYGNVPSTCGATDTMNAYFTSYTFTNNVIPCGGASCSSPNWPPPVPGRYPTGNFFPASIDPGVGFVNYSGGDYHLAASSPYKNQATDGTDPGANIDALNAMTVNAGLGAARPPETVLWTNISNATATGSGTIRGTATSQGCPTCPNDSRAVSQQQIGSGDGSLQFTAPDINHEYVVSIGRVAPGWAGNWAIHFTGTGFFEVREGSWSQKTTPAMFIGGDYFQIAIVNGCVNYLRNGAVFYTSATCVGGQYPIQAFVTLWSSFAVVSNALISTGVH